MSQLVVHKGGWIVTEDELRTIQIPDQTDTYYPVSYVDSIQSIRARAKEAGYSITKEQFALNKKGNQMFGVIDINRGNNEEGWALGIRNSYDKSIGFGLCGGLRTFVCDNLAFSGDMMYLHKHTKNISLDRALLHVFTSSEDGDSLLSRSLNERIKYIQFLKTLSMDKEEASYWTIEAARRGLIPKRDVVRVMDESFHPTYPEFKQYVGTAYGWTSSITLTAQKYSPAKQMSTCMGLDDLLKIKHAGQPG
jgi:hypothetical protein